MAHRLVPRGGVDMEALSPRDVNAQRMPRATETKAKPVAQLKSKDKEHPPPPPEEVLEPSSTDRPDGAVYRVGKLLGKGGFAICYSGQLLPTKQKYALKIVKSQMPSKMEQKVGNAAEHLSTSKISIESAHVVAVPNRITNPLENAPQEYRPVPTSLLIRQLHFSSPRAVSQRLSYGHGKAAKGPHRTRSSILLSPDLRRHQIHAQQGYHPPRSENGQHFSGSPDECQDWRLRPCCVGGDW